MTLERQKIEEVARLSYGRLVAILTRRLGNISRAEDALGDALLQALETWPETGIPENPEGWILKTSRNRAIDRIRSEALATTYEKDLQNLFAPTTTVSAPSDIDPRVALMFTCAHPAINVSVRAPLMLQTVLGLDARRMASVYLTSPGTLGQKLTRAKARIQQLNIPFELPGDEDFGSRLDDVLAAIYAAYAIGYDGLSTGDQKASSLAREALWLISTICHALPDAAEAHGLFALILYAEARRAARIDPATGAMIPLEEQDTSFWDSALLADAERALGNARRNLSLERFQLEASIQAVHCARRKSGSTNWGELRILYQGLVSLSPTLGALTGQAVVEARLKGAERGLALLEAIEPKLRAGYQPWHAAKAHLAAEAGLINEAEAAYALAIGLSDDPAARIYLMKRQSSLSSA
jgi:RNA polymerase sigma-70 factor (ECF subfamily)